jgi:hypothetical protein
MVRGEQRKTESSQEKKKTLKSQKIQRKGKFGQSLHTLLIEIGSQAARWVWHALPAQNCVVDGGGRFSGRGRISHFLKFLIKFIEIF